jgi:hypothetical protein
MPFPHLFPPPNGTNYPRQDLFHPPVLWFCKRKKNDIFCLFKEFPYDSPIYICIITWVSSSLLWSLKTNSMVVRCTTRFKISYQYFMSCMTLSKLVSFSVPQFPHLENDDRVVDRIK